MARAGECTVIGTYFSPNGDTKDLETLLHDIGKTARDSKEPVILAGDLNAKSPLWGSRVVNERGTVLAEWVVGSGMIVANEGNSPTFERGGSSSVIDITLASEVIIDRLTEWKVHLDIENLSDHHYITFSLATSDKTRRDQEEHQKSDRLRKSWRVDKEALEAVEAEMKMADFDGSTDDPGKCVMGIQAILNRTCLSRRAQSKRKPVHWWCEEIAICRKACLSERRRLTRARGKKNSDLRAIRLANTKYKVAKKALKKSISRAQKEKWSELLETVNKDPWGKAYNVVTGKLQGRAANPDGLERLRVAQSLFPTHPTISWAQDEWTGEVTPFSESEIQAAADRIKIGKAPGPDGIPPAVVRIFLRTQPKAATALMNSLFLRGVFPEEWKRASLVLVPKPKKQDTDAPTYRPICLLDVMGKVYERLVLNRLERDLETGDGLSDDQFGFRKGRSTVDAVRRVIQLATEEEDRFTTYRDRPVSALIAVDVQNAFNSAPWPDIISALSRKGISSHIINIIKSYLSDRKLEVSPGRELEVTCGVPQGSILGPTLWNCFYDKMLRTRIPHTSLVGYADDLIAVVTARNRTDLEERGSLALEKILERAEEMGITIAAQKTEAIIARGRRKVMAATFTAGGQTIATKGELRYLGVIINRNLSMTTHVEYAAGKAARAMKKLMGLMPNRKGPGQKTRKILAAAVYSVILYASPAWESTVRRACHLAKLIKIQRVINIRVTQAYRTTSSDALCVLAGYPPMRLMIESRGEVYRMGAQDKQRIKEETMERWQRSWEESSSGKWTRSLLPNIKPWLERNAGETEYFLTQFLTGHGNFKTYLARIGKTNNNRCDHCGKIDDPGHTVLKCLRWKKLRECTERMVGRELITRTVLPNMTESEEGWRAVHSYIRTVLSKREAEDQQEQEELAHARLAMDRHP